MRRQRRHAGGYGHDRKSCTSFRSVDMIPVKNLPVLYDKLRQPGAPPYADLFPVEFKGSFAENLEILQENRHWWA